MVDPATITAAITAATAGVQLIDKIADQVMRFVKKEEPHYKPFKSEITKEGNAIVRKQYGEEAQRITADDLQKLPEKTLRHVRVYEQAMENHYAVWAAVYPQLALEPNPIAKARIELQLKSIIAGMKGDLEGILNFLKDAGFDLDDHYIEVRDVVNSVQPLSA